jgi:type I restriction enzyme S subunit
VPVPPIEEQRAIADHLDEKCAAIDAMVTEKESLIADLEAYKKSLIYETVTGKREVA